MSSIQIHHINGIPYPYRHTWKDGKVVCVLVKGSHQDRRITATGTPASTRLKNSLYESSYHDQDDLDAYIRRAYNLGYGVGRIRKIFEDIDLHPTRRETENYLTRELGVVLRKREKAAPVVHEDLQAELSQTKEDLAVVQIEQDSKDTRIKEMAAETEKTELENRILKEKLMNFRDMGRAPTDDEITALL